MESAGVMREEYNYYVYRLFLIFPVYIFDDLVQRGLLTFVCEILCYGN